MAAQENQTIPEEAGCVENLTVPLSGAEKNRTIVWAIAGFDPSSGAGVTADLMTFAAHGLFGCSAITALTVQNTVGVFGWEPVDQNLLRETLRRLGEDLPCAGVKIGMLGTAEAAVTAAAALRTGGSLPKHRRRPVVLDPVLRSSSGRELFPERSLDMLHRELLPEVDWVTPNWAELALLTGSPVHDGASAAQAARLLLARHPHLHVVATGGDQDEPEDLLLLPDGTLSQLRGQRVATTSTHGTGCAFSSALLSALVLGAAPLAAVQQAKHYVEEALRAAPGLGGGRGPMGLLWSLRRRADDPDPQLLL